MSDSVNQPAALGLLLALFGCSPAGDPAGVDSGASTGQSVTGQSVPGQPNADTGAGDSSGAAQGAGSGSDFLLPAPSPLSAFGKAALLARARLLQPGGVGFAGVSFQVGTFIEGMQPDQVPWAAVTTDAAGRFQFPLADWIAPREVPVRFLFRAAGPGGELRFAVQREGPFAAEEAGHVDLGEFTASLP